ncbi:MAG: hypothetical protein AAFQ63_04915 [Cyanobacteria bacterium J06621_11]
MTDKPEPDTLAVPDNLKDLSAEVSQAETSETKAAIVEPVTSTEGAQLSTRDSFLIGTAAGGFLSLVFLGFSMEMAHIPLSEVSAVAWGAVIATTFLFGGLGVRFKHKFFDALASVLPVPF